MSFSEIFTNKIRSLGLKDSKKKDITEPLLDVEAKAAHHQAMDSLLARMLQGEDVSDYFMKVIMASDTRDICLKAKINYFLYVYGKKKGLLDLTVNTLLKDFTDPLIELRILATSFVRRIPYVDEYFLRQMINMLQTGSAKEARQVCLSLPRFFKRSDWVQKYGIKNILRQHCLSPDATSGISAAVQVFNECRILSLDEVLQLVECARGSKERKLLILELIGMHIKSGDINTQHLVEQTTKILLGFVRGFSTVLVVSASQLLLMLDSSYAQMVFDNLVELYKIASFSERIYILKLLDDIIRKDSQKKIRYLNSDFIITSDDSKEVQKIKMNLILYYPDRCAFKEIEYISRFGNLSFECLLVKLFFNHPDASLFTQCFEKNRLLTLKIVDLVSKISEDWALIIHDQISKIKNTKRYRTYIINILQKTVVTEIAYKRIEFICKKISNHIGSDCNKLFVCLSKWYSMNILGEEDFKEYNKRSFLNRSFFQKLIGMKKEILEQKFTQTVCKDATRKYLKLKYKSKRNMSERDKVNLYIKNLILGFNSIFHQSNFDMIINSKNDIDNVKSIDVIDIHPVEETMSRSIKSFKLSYCKLDLKVCGSTIQCHIFDVEKLLRFEVEQHGVYHTIIEEKHIDICQVSDTFKSEILKISLGNEKVECEISLKDLVQPYDCDLTYFNKRFEELTHYEILNDQLSELNVNRFGDNMFAFKILEYEFLAISISNQVVVKSSSKNLLTSLAKICE